MAPNLENAGFETLMLHAGQVRLSSPSMGAEAERELAGPPTEQVHLQRLRMYKWVFSMIQAPSFTY